MQLSPWHAGLAEPSPTRLRGRSASTTCWCPGWLSPLGKSLTHGFPFRTRPPCRRDRTRRDAAHIHARAFHRDLPDVPLAEPVAQGQQIGGHRAESAHRPLDRPVVVRHQHAGHHRALVHVESSTPRMHHLHSPLPSLRVAARECEPAHVSPTCSPPGAPARGRRHSSDPGRTPVSLSRGLVAPNSRRPTVRGHVRRMPICIPSYGCPSHGACQLNRHATAEGRLRVWPTSSHRLRQRPAVR
jgi:hypothetical protein